MVFALNLDGTGFTNLYSFAATHTNSSGIYTNSDGANPSAGLILSGRTLIGTAFGGGTNGYGTVFSLTLPPPRLTITLSGTNAILTWPINSAGFTLQSTTNLVAPAFWTSNLPCPIVFNGQNVVTNPISAKKQFFRLSQ